MLIGKGTEESPYLIGDANELGAIRWEPRAHYCLVSDVNLPGILWTSSVVPWFNGSLDGRGHVIRYLHMEEGAYLGLFGTLAPSSTVINLGLEEVFIQSEGDNIGGLAGINKEGTISKCYITGLVEANDSCVGGLVGVNEEGTISKSYSTGSVTGSIYIGGLVGWNNDGDVSISYAMGMVSGSSTVGGLVGNNDGSISNSYSTNTVNGEYLYIGGLVGDNSGSIMNSYSVSTVTGYEDVGGLIGNRWSPDVTNCFWECGPGADPLGTGCTPTADMQDIRTFLDAGWDIESEKFNGKETIWWMPEDNYPRFRWEIGYETSP